jgi:recombination DNA repair RAD52 pathway protein
LKKKEEDWEYERSDFIDKIKQIQSKKSNIELFHEQHRELELEKQQLQQTLQKHREDKERELEEKQREKIEATDKLKKDMLHRI